MAGGRIAPPATDHHLLHGDDHSHRHGPATPIRDVTLPHAVAQTSRQASAADKTLIRSPILVGAPSLRRARVANRATAPFADPSDSR